MTTDELKALRDATTPGPWGIYSRAACSVEAQGQRSICSTGGYMASWIDGAELLAENEANARLIATAPDLLDELLALREAHKENARILGYLANELQGRIEAGKLEALSKCADRSRAALAHTSQKGGDA